MSSWLFIVSPTKRGTYTYLKLVTDTEDAVIVDRRKADRRRIQQRATRERRHGERRHRDVTGELQSSGWAAVRRVGHPMTPGATRCVEPRCQEEGVVGVSGAWLCLKHFDIRYAAMQAMRGRPST